MEELTGAEVARRLGICRQAVSRQIRAGRIPARRVGPIWLVPARFADLAVWRAAIGTRRGPVSPTRTPSP